MATNQLLDPITIEVRWNRLISIMEEVDATVVRTSFSTIVGESRDFGAIILDRHGRSLAQSQLSSPAFVSHLPITAKHLLRVFPADTLAQGDVLITNDPWIGTGHLPDLSIFTPVFYEGQLVGFIACAAHVADIGGRLDYFGARDVFEEGVRIPPSRLVVGGTENEDLLQWVAANVRVPDVVVGDIHAIVAAERIGVERVREFLTDCGGAAAFQALADEILNRSEQAMRQALRELPNGEWQCDINADGFRTLLHIHVKITKQDDRIDVDFGGSSPQFDDASINSVINCTIADSFYPFKCSLTPSLPNNEGLYRPLNVVAPQSSVLNTTFPSAVNARSKASCHCHTAIYGAMAEVMPEKIQAGSGDFWVVDLYGTRPDGDRFRVLVLIHGGKGATAQMDGLSTITFPYNGSVTPVEIIENQAPVIVEFKRLVQDSGGAGQCRGGLGQEFKLRARARLSATVFTDKVTIPPPGVLGGRPGLPGRFVLNGLEGPAEPRTLVPGDWIYVRLPGGGGYGDPRKRALKAVVRDMVEGYVSLETARNEYGVDRFSQPNHISLPK